MECRINAEDPFRGFLPSTGRLVRYQPPTPTMEAAAPMPADGGIRVDTGVYEGGEIPMYYDSMIAKLIVHGRDRGDAIAPHARGAERIRDPRRLEQHAVPVGAARAPEVRRRRLQHRLHRRAASAGLPPPRTCRTTTPTSWLALAAVANRRYLERAAGISGQFPGHGVQIGANFVVVVKGREGRHEHMPVAVQANGSFAVTVGERRYEIAMDWRFGDIRATGTCNGRPFTAQIERSGVWFRVEHDGLRIDAMVLSPLGAELLNLMPYKAPPDTSRFLLSPMPGLLVDVGVKAGQAVREGERLAVIEAMKMENIRHRDARRHGRRGARRQGQQPGGRSADPEVRRRRR